MVSILSATYSTKNRNYFSPLRKMNISKSLSEIYFINFNQDYSCISVGSKSGYKIYNCDPFGKCYSKNQGGVGIVEMLFCTSLVALVGSGDQPQLSPRRLLIKNTKRETTICELTFPTTIYNIKLNRRRLVVVLEEQIYIYDISNMKLLHTIETAPNPKGICAMSSSSEHCFIAYPAPSIASSSSLANGGTAPNPILSDVMIFDANACEAMSIIQAHKGPISCLSINSDGTMLATASEKGTVIRVFSIPSPKKIAQFRRGTYSANINNMSFNLRSTMLLVSSDSDTIHIFRIQDGVMKRPGMVESSSSPIGDTANTSEYSGSKHTLGITTASPGTDARRNTGHHYLNSETSVDLSDFNDLSSTQTTTAKEKSKKSWKGLMSSKIIGKAASYIPGQISQIWEPSRDFAYIKLPKPGLQNIAAMLSQEPQIVVVTEEGFVYLYGINLNEGGQCQLLKQYSLQDSEN